MAVITVANPKPVPIPDGMVASGKATPQLYQFLQSLRDTVGNITAGLSTASDLTYGETFAIGGSLANQTYNVLINAPFGFTISNIVSKCRSGTATATFKIAGTSLGGTANSVSSSEDSQDQASANVVAAGDDVTCVISANASCIDAVFTITYTRT